MKLTLILRGNAEHPATATATAVLRGWLARGTQVQLIFLQADAVALSQPQSGNMAEEFQQLIQHQQLPVRACVGGAAARDFCDQSGAPLGEWLPGVSPASLGELAMEIEHSDRVVTLG